MAYFEMTLINGQDRQNFDISVNEALYYYLVCHQNAHPLSDDWFTLTLTNVDVIIMKKLCENENEVELIAKNIQNGTIVDILIHRTILIGDD